MRKIEEITNDIVKLNSEINELTAKMHELEEELVETKKNSIQSFLGQYVEFTDSDTLMFVSKQYIVNDNVCMEGPYFMGRRWMDNDKKKVTECQAEAWYRSMTFDIPTYKRMTFASKPLIKEISKELFEAKIEGYLQDIKTLMNPLNYLEQYGTKTNKRKEQ